MNTYIFIFAYANYAAKSGLEILYICLWTFYSTLNLSIGLSAGFSQLKKICTSEFPPSRISRARATEYASQRGQLKYERNTKNCTSRRGRNKRLFSLCGTPSRPNAKHTTSCFRHDQGKRSVNHQTPDISIRSSMYALRQDAMAVPPVWHFHIHVSNFSNRKVNLSYQMKISYAVRPPSFICAVDTVRQNTAFIKTSAAFVNSFASDLIALIEVKQHHPGRHDVSALNFKPFESRDAQISLHTAVQNYVSHQRARNRRDEVHLSHKNSSYNNKFIGMSTDFKASGAVTLTE